jgi:uncharacterized protein YukE
MGHGEDLAASHIAADSRIASAEPGWAGRSAMAMSSRAAVWSARSTALVAAIGNHATNMHTSAACFAASEEYVRETMSAVHPGPSSTASVDPADL